MRINLFGKLALVAADGTPVPVSGSKTQGLIAFLAMNLDMPPPRDRIMALFWGDRFTEQARQSLRQAVSKLRRLGEEYGEDIICSDEDRIGFDPSVVQVDVDDFFHLAEQPGPENAEKALAVMKGPLLEGMFGQQAEFEDWLATERQRVISKAEKLFEQVANHQLRQGDLPAALDTARKLTALDPLRDRSQMLLIRTLAQSGERAAAIKQFNSYEATLRKELGVGAGPELEKLLAEIKSEKVAAADAPKAARAAAPASKPVPEPVTAERPSIALAPFAPIRPDPKADFFAASITEDIVVNLSRFKWLDVHASIDIEGVRLTPGALRKAHEELGLKYLLHGVIRIQGRKFRLTVQLVEPKTGRYLWAHRYDRETDDIYEIQDALADKIAAAVEAELQRIAGRASQSIPFEEMSAWDSYHRGLAIQYEFSARTNADAQTHFRRAIELDPNFAAAYARLSYAMVISAIYFDASEVQDLLDEALDLARTAARLDPDDAVVRFALGRVYLARGEYDRSLAELGSAVDLNPGLAQAHCGLGDSLAYSGDLDGAMSCFVEAVRISPTDPHRWAFLSYGATALLFKKDFEEAVAWATRAEAVPNSHFWATAVKASALGHLGRKEEAQAAVQQLRKSKPGINCDYVRERLFYLRDARQLDLYVDGLRKAGLA